jgi:hypothetical protein
MVGIKDLPVLLNSIKPELDKRDFVFCSVSEEKLKKLILNPTLKFKEKEGMTLIITKEDADKNELNYENIWSLISLTVHSDLNAVGFLATIATKLAENDISINAVSAYYHDYLFVPKDKSKKALELINEFSK